MLELSHHNFIHFIQSSNFFLPNFSTHDHNKQVEVNILCRQITLSWQKVIYILYSIPVLSYVSPAVSHKVTDLQLKDRLTGLSSNPLGGNQLFLWVWNFILITKNWLFPRKRIWKWYTTSYKGSVKIKIKWNLYRL